MIFLGNQPGNILGPEHYVVRKTVSTVLLLYLGESVERWTVYFYWITSQTSKSYHLFQSGLDVDPCPAGTPFIEVEGWSLHSTCQSSLKAGRLIPPVWGLQSCDHKGWTLSLSDWNCFGSRFLTHLHFKNFH